MKWVLTAHLAEMNHFCYILKTNEAIRERRGSKWLVDGVVSGTGPWIPKRVIPAYFVMICICSRYWQYRQLDRALANPLSDRRPRKGFPSCLCIHVGMERFRDDSSNIYQISRKAASMDRAASLANQWLSPKDVNCVQTFDMTCYHVL